MRATLYSGDTFDRGGKTFRVQFEHDSDASAPWEDDCGRGIVSEWTARAKRPGELILAEDRHSKRYYDVSATMKIARRDGWDAEPYGQGTKGERAARAVAADFDYLRQWCDDQWEYVGVIVTMIDKDGEETHYTDSCWRVETFKDYHVEVARECADNILAEVKEDKAKAREEARERRYWEARDVQTI